MAKTRGYKIMKDGTMILHPDIGSDQAKGDSIQIPRVDTAEGAGFGDTIADSDRAFAAEREPVAHFLTFGVAADITEKWFIINDPDTVEADPALDRTIQTALSKLDFKKHLTEALESERIYGESVLVGAFSDAQNVDALKQPLKSGSELLQLAVYPGTKSNHKTKEFTVESVDQDKNSNRFGEPVIYKLDRGSGSFLYVHHTRVCKVQTRSNATSVLDPIWDDLTCGRNIRWGASQWMYRTGGGFATIGFPAGTTAENLEAYHNTQAFSNLMSRTAIFIAQNSVNENDGMTFDFKGAAGHSLDPAPFFQTNIEQIAIATGIPQAKLVGTQAGAVTGSEVNMQDYFKVVSREQAKLEPVIRWVIDHLADSDQLTIVKAAVDKENNSYQINLLKKMLRRVIRRDYRHKTAENYVVEWNSAFELSELDTAQVEQLNVQANQGKLDYMTIDEVRAEENLDPLPNGEGASLKKSSLGLFGEEQGKEGNEELAENDKFLVVDLQRKGRQSSRRLVGQKPIIDEDTCTAEGGHWKTIRGTPVCIKEGESVEEAFERTTGKSLKEGKALSKGEGKTTMPTAQPEPYNTAPFTSPEPTMLSPAIITKSPQTKKLKEIPKGKTISVPLTNKEFQAMLSTNYRDIGRAQYTALRRAGYDPTSPNIEVLDFWGGKLTVKRLPDFKVKRVKKRVSKNKVNMWTRKPEGW